MATVKEITKAEFLELYAQDHLDNLIRVEGIGGENRIYARAGYQSGDEPEGCIVVYVVE